MISVINFESLFSYNVWANDLILKSCKELTKEQLEEPRRAFFSSIWGTLNHIFVGSDIIKSRVAGYQTHHKRLDSIVFDTFEDLDAAQREIDGWFVNEMRQMTPERETSFIEFNTVGHTPEFFRERLGICLTSLFQHHIHHRGQIHQMLSEIGAETPVLDFVVFSAETQERV